MVSEGNVAPDFTLPDENGNQVSLSQFRGRKVILYFYPKDDTPGCTTEACGIRDSFPNFEASGAVVLGVSPDSVESHKKFKEKYNLPFTLLADTDHKVAEMYGVWGTKKMYGREFTGVLRTTFLIDEEGKVQKVFKNVKPDVHAQELVEALAS
ncbi:alkyl hydroperoxide reductase/ Thiol specific antioxidant/ Mal allergen [Thermobaculum terrenum ATCC BAA-798]|uniref:thioredoxin-dependent peroxiredoxin n=1 Tax=Thermobaculum terrenum (strain ATCC BAA-798 / CCMEE 7001 / YNP1) TaxID=525904 RepID=D1CCR7_THET1|nr:thioredoxin-dependent thiol peroxidase [Thermobaculum terrenum]ACZ42582.1 alkyl hydroperoxide reductase/ Thiol specific antioxidant/ Mal allergen [Thermobaculum terrenum ATCC BAA-798]